MNVKKASIARKLFLFTAMLITASMLIVGAISLFQYRSSAIDEIGQRANAIASSVAAAIDGDIFEETAAGGEENFYTQYVYDLVNDVHRAASMQFLYVLYDINDSTVTYFAEANDEFYTDYLTFGEKEGINEHDLLVIDTYRTGNKNTTGLYATEVYPNLLSAYDVIRNSKGAIVGVVGADISAESLTSGIIRFGVIILATAIGLSFLFGFAAYLIIKRTIGKPVAELTAAANKLAVGETDIDVRVKSNDEIGQLVKSFIMLEQRTQTQVSAIQEIADGNYTIDVEPESARDVLNVALKSMLNENNRVFTKVQSVSAQVASASSELAAGALTLAEGSTTQAQGVAELSLAIGTVFEQTRINAHSAEETLDVVTNVSELMQESMGNMENMREAMLKISSSSEDIGKIIKTIDDIAFQTNILALNASVEAARAGQHGKGFAVVADEVRNLARKSAEAASETALLIQRSFDQVSVGDKIVQDTSTSIRKVAESAELVYSKIRQINESIKEHEAAVARINTGVEQITHVVQLNSATSEQSAAMSNEMSDQARALSEITGRFRLRDDDFALQKYNDRY